MSLLGQEEDRGRGEEAEEGGGGGGQGEPEVEELGWEGKAAGGRGAHTRILMHN